MNGSLASVTYLAANHLRVTSWPSIARPASNQVATIEVRNSNGETATRPFTYTPHLAGQFLMVKVSTAGPEVIGIRRACDPDSMPNLNTRGDPLVRPLVDPLRIQQDMEGQIPPATYGNALVSDMLGIATATGVKLCIPLYHIGGSIGGTHLTWGVRTESIRTCFSFRLRKPPLQRQGA